MRLKKKFQINQIKFFSFSFSPDFVKCKACLSKFYRLQFVLGTYVTLSSSALFKYHVLRLHSTSENQSPEHYAEIAAKTVDLFKSKMKIFLSKLSAGLNGDPSKVTDMSWFINKFGKTLGNIEQVKNFYNDFVHCKLRNRDTRHEKLSEFYSYFGMSYKSFLNCLSYEVVLRKLIRTRIFNIAQEIYPLEADPLHCLARDYQLRVGTTNSVRIFARSYEHRNTSETET